MKCQGCGHEYPSTFPRCSRCGELNPRRSQRPSPSRLIEFPRKTRPNIEAESNDRALPAWRKELNERVRAVRARRNTTGTDPVPQTVPPKHDIRRPVNVGLNHDSVVSRASAPSSSAVQRVKASNPLLEDVETETTASTQNTSNINSAIVEAALTRVQRASESAYRSSLARTEQPRSAPPQPASIVMDKQATARALETSAEVVADQNPRAASQPTTRFAEQQSAQRETIVPSPPATLALPAELIPEPAESPQPVPRNRTNYQPVEVEKVEKATLPPVDEIEPYDYLEREIQRIDRTHNHEFAHDESASLGVHLIIGVVDVLTILVSAVPFIAVLQIMNGSIADRRTQIAAALILSLVSFFYLAVTQCLVSKTFGMMLTNTRVVEAHTSDIPSGQRLLLRTVSYFIALAPAAIGFLWILLDRRRRGWHDFISGTRVVRDF